ncbi:MAG: hypothetical protein ACP5SH_24100 [Syntrophobacteraceae bacterium]
MRFLVWYLYIGLVVMGVIFLSHRISEMRNSKSGEIWSTTGRAWRRSLVDTAGTFLAAGFMVPVWPLVIYLKGGDFSKRRSAATAEKNHCFVVSRSDLLEILTIEEIERRERVIDPMGAVPELPFGHLHGAWKKFLQDSDRADEIRSFSAIRTTRWGQKELRAGYVCLRGGDIGRHFLTLWKPVDEENEKAIRPPDHSG